MVPMRYRLLGNSGLRVSEFALGTMTFGTSESWGCSKAVSRTIFDAYMGAGGNLVDTASFYAGGRSEACLQDFIAKDRDAVVLTTKCAYGPLGRDPNAAGLHRKYLPRAVEASLKRLDTDYIDLLWVNGWDFMTPEQEVMRSLEDLLRAGKLLYIGIADAPAWVVSKCNTLAELKGWTPFVGLQVQYSLAERSAERELLPMARAGDLGVAACSPLAGGFLTGKYAEGDHLDFRLAQEDFNNFRDHNDHLSAVVASVAAEAGCKPSQVALAWVRDQNIIPVLGARSLAQVEENLGTLELSLSINQTDRLNSASQIELGYPHDFLCKTRLPAYAGMYERIHRHRDRGNGVSK